MYNSCLGLSFVSDVRDNKQGEKYKNNKITRGNICNWMKNTYPVLLILTPFFQRRTCWSCDGNNIIKIFIKIPKNIGLLIQKAKSVTKVSLC